MRIQHNIMAMNAYRNYTNNVSAMKANLEKLSSGYKINRAGDDAAGLAISEKMRAQITGLETAQKNAKDGISLVQTAEGALTEVHDMLNRMVELATQSANGTYDNTTDRKALQQELDQLKEEINRISKATNYNGINLLDGSMDSTVRTINNDMAEGFGIADWVGSLNNASAVVGTGTIVHTGSEAAKETSFAIELNNSTVNGSNGVKLTLGEGDNAVTLELDGTEIQAGATADEIAAAIAEKYKDGVDFKGADGSDVKFNVTANGDRIELVQAEKPANANQVVKASMALTTEGIGMPDGENVRLNNAAPEVKLDKDNAAKLTAQSFSWGTSVADEDKDALNTALSGGVDIRVTTTSGGTGNETDAASHKVNLKALQDALGEDFHLSIKETAGSTNLTNSVSDKGILDLTSAQNSITIDILNKNDEKVGTLSLTLAAASGGLSGNATANAELNTTVTVGPGNNQAMNTAPAVTVTDDGHLQKDGATTLFALESGLTADQLDALNQALSAGEGSITLQASDLAADNKFKAGSKVDVTLSDALANAGYQLATAWTSASSFTAYNKDTGIAVAAGDISSSGAKNLFLLDKDGNKIATMKIDTDASANAKVTSQASKITLSPAKFNKEQAVTDGLKQTISVSLKAATPTDLNEDPTNIAGIDWTSTTANAVTWHEGDELTLTIDGTDYTFTIGNGLSQAQKDSGKFIEIGTTDLGKPATMLTQLTAALKKQMDNNAKEAAAGSEDYKEYVTSGTGALTLTANAATPNKIDVKADTIQNVYIDTTAADDTDAADGASGSTNVGGQDYNAATVTQVQGNAASSGRLASTYITAEDLAGLKDGSQMRVGDKVYTFAVGKDSKAEGDNIVDLTHMEVGDAGLSGEALSELYKVTTAAADNAMFSTGYDGTKLTFTENKEYTWGEGVDLSTHEGIAEQFGFYTDGMTSTTQGKSLTLQIGDTADDYNQISLNISATDCTSLGLDAISVADQEDAQAAVDVIKAAINQVSTIRGTLGATQNRLDHTINNLSVMTENIQDAESTIRDVDVAEEMMAYTKNNILIQSAQAMLAQANQVPQGVLQLLG